MVRYSWVMPPVVTTPGSNRVPVMAVTSLKWLSGPKITPMLPIRVPWSAMISSAPAMAYMPPEADMPSTKATTLLPVRSW